IFETGALGRLPGVLGYPRPESGVSGQITHAFERCKTPDLFLSRRWGMILHRERTRRVEVRFHPPALGGLGHVVGHGHPTAPSICSSISRLSSSAYSIGSSLAIGSTKPRTIVAIASSSVTPRFIR